MITCESEKIKDFSKMIVKKAEKLHTTGLSIHKYNCIPDVVLKNEGSIVHTCQNINVNVINTDICCDLLECLKLSMDYIRNKPFNVHSISKKL